MTVPDPIPLDRLHPGDFVSSVDARDLVYFLANVGDGDLQVILLPAGRDGTRQAIVVDVASARKLAGLLEELAGTPLLPPRADLFPVVVGTHPHDDHIGGMASFIDRFGDMIDEYWEPGYYHPSSAYMESMRALEDHGGIQHTQPTSGMTRFIGNVRVTVLSPAMGLRNRFDSYGVDINNSSIALRIEFPAARVEQRRADRRYVKLPRRQVLILGADAQSLAWGHVMADFPELRPDNSPVAKALRMALGANPLHGQLFKIPHHASKHGVHLELVEAVHPSLTLISSVGGGGRYNFPHSVAQESVREALQPRSSTAAPHEPDHDLGIHYTCAVDAAGDPLGTIAVVKSPTGRKTQVWRFGDARSDPVDLADARLFL